MPEIVSAASKAISRLMLILSATGLVLMTGVIAWQVWVRFVLQDAAPWTEQAALLLMVYYVLFAAAAGVREGFHIRLSVAVDAMPGRVKRGAEIVAHLAVAVFGAAMLVWGSALVAETWRHVIPTLGLPRGAAYIPIPLSGAMIVFFALEQTARRLLNSEVEPVWE